MTYPLILAKIPVKNPWEIFAYLPFGNWNECPNTPELMALPVFPEVPMMSVIYRNHGDKALKSR